MLEKDNDGNDKLVRFGVSMEQGLLERFDKLTAKKGYANRSEAIRDLVRAELVKHRWQESKSTRQVAVLAIVYEHEHSDLMHKLMHFQHENENLIISSVHIHMDRDNCMEVLILRGQTKQIEQFAENIISIKGVKYGQLMRGTTGKEI